MLVAAAQALARIGTRDGAEAIVEAAGDPRWAPWLVEPLGEFGLGVVEPALRRLATSNGAHAGARRAAREGLWKLDVLSASDREMALVQALHSGVAPERRAWAAWRLGDEEFTGSTDALAAALADRSNRVAMAAAAALLRWRVPEAWFGSLIVAGVVLSVALQLIWFTGWSVLPLLVNVALLWVIFGQHVTVESLRV